MILAWLSRFKYPSLALINIVKNIIIIRILQFIKILQGSLVGFCQVWWLLSIYAFTRNNKGALEGTVDLRIIWLLSCMVIASRGPRDSLRLSALTLGN